MVKRFTVDSYTVSLADYSTATWGNVQIKARGILACYGDGHRLIIYFLTDDSPCPNPVFIPGNRVGAIFLPFRDMPAYVDLVRNEGPIFAYLNSDRPEWNGLSTSREPIGEAE